VQRSSRANWKVCIVTTVPMTIRQFVLPTVRHLCSGTDFSVTIVCSPDETLRDELPPTAKFYPIAMARGFKLGGVGAAIRLFMFFRREKFDLVQYSTPNAALFSSIAAWAARVPVRLYGQWGLRYVGAEGGMRALLKTLERLTCKLSTDIRPVSSRNLQCAIDARLYPASKARLVGRGGTIGVDLDRFDPNLRISARDAASQFSGVEDKFVFGFVGRFTKDKGVNELLGAFRALAQETGNVALACVGPLEGDAGIEGDLLHWARESKVVIWTGYVEPSQMPVIYASLDCLVHPTYREGFAMVLQEAAAMALPVITTEIPGASEVLTPEESCLLVPPRDRRALEKAMREVLNDGNLRADLGRNARKEAVTYYSQSRMIRRQSEDYLQLLSAFTSKSASRRGI